MQPITILVGDTNDAPAVTPLVIDPIPEDTTSGSVVATLDASDPDGDDLRYAITSGTGVGVFSIDPLTGDISVASSLDFETDPTFRIVIEVTDNGAPTQSTSVTLNIAIADANDGPIVPSPQAFSVDENSPAATLVSGGTVTATDPDNDTLTFSLTDPAGLFDIDPTTGQIFRTILPLDFEATPSVDLIVTATDPAGANNAASVTIAVVDTNDAPEFPALTPIGIPEDTALGVIGNVAAADQDGDTLTYTVSGPDSGLFEVAANGELSLLGPIDFEADPSYLITLIARDDHSPAASTATTIQINISNVNEPPTIAAGQVFTSQRSSWRRRFGITWCSRRQ